MMGAATPAGLKKLMNSIIAARRPGHPGAPARHIDDVIREMEAAGDGRDLADRLNELHREGAEIYFPPVPPETAEERAAREARVAKAEREWEAKHGSLTE